MDLLKVSASERVDLDDFNHAIDTAIQAAQREPLAELMTNPAGAQRLWILQGFGMSSPVGKQVQVNRGTALLGQREGSDTFYATLVCAGDTTQIVDINSYGSGTYGVYVRFAYVDGSSASRVFWNAAGAAETSQATPTRRLANWQLRVETTSPGSEWLLIGTVDWTTMAFTDLRPFYFEGKPSTSYASEWGGGTDRSASRSTYPIRDMQTFTAAMRQSIEDIKGSGLRRWWAADIGGLCVGYIGSPAEDAVRIGDANFELVNKVTDGTAGSTVEVRYNGVNHATAYNRTTHTLTHKLNSVVRTTMNPTGWSGTANAPSRGSFHHNESTVGVGTAYFENTAFACEVAAFGADNGANTRPFAAYYSVSNGTQQVDFGIVSAAGSVPSIGGGAAGDWMIRTGGVNNRLRVGYTTGNVAINADVTAAKLGVNGNLAIGAAYINTAPPTDGGIIVGPVGIGTAGPLSKLDVNGGVAIGAYAGANAAPANGLLVSGAVAFGTSTPNASSPGNVTCTGLFPSGSSDIGNNTYRWANLFVTAINAVSATLSGTVSANALSAVTLAISGNAAIGTFSAMLPNSNGSLDNGATGARWNVVWANQGIFNGAAPTPSTADHLATRHQRNCVLAWGLIGAPPGGGAGGAATSSDGWNLSSAIWSASGTGICTITLQKAINTSAACLLPNVTNDNTHTSISGTFTNSTTLTFKSYDGAGGLTERPFSYVVIGLAA